MADDDITIRLRLREAARFNRDTRKSAREVDNLGDQAQQAARKMAALSLASSNARLNLGPLSVRPRAAALSLGALVLVTEKAAGGLLGIAEAGAVVAGGGAAAGGVGFLAIAQGAGVLSLALGDLQDALGGNEDAMKRLGPRGRELFDSLEKARSGVQGAARAGLMPGLAGGAEAALRNRGVAERVSRRTGAALGRVAQEGGNLLGSRAFGRDLERIGNTNVEIVENLGHAAIDGASAIRHLAVEAGPLAEWMSRLIRDGARLTEVWIANKRETGELAEFFRDARRDIEILGRGIGAGGRGVINLFGANDVDGTRTLENFERLMRRFEAWSESPAVQGGLGEALTAEIPQAVAAVMDTVADNLPGAAARAGEVFWDTFWAANTEGKALIAALTGAKIAGAIRGQTRFLPLYVENVGGLPMGGPSRGGKGRGGFRLPGWLGKGAKGLGGIGAAMLAMEAAGRVIPGDDPAAKVIREGGAFGGKTPSGFGNTPAGQLQERVRRQSRGLIGTLPPIDVHVHSHIDGREVHKSVVRVERDEVNRRGGGLPQGMQSF